jgi:hypothetical protein
MKNDYEIRGEVTAIFIKHRNGNVSEVLIDTVDLNFLIEYKTKWRFSGNSSNLYVRSMDNVMLHRYLLNPAVGMVVDHVNHNTLDNRRKNIRVITQAQNTQNKKHLTKSKSGFRNVAWNNRLSKWRVKIVVNKKCISVGHFGTINDAIEAEREARIKYMPFSQDAI